MLAENKFELHVRIFRNTVIMLPDSIIPVVEVGAKTAINTCPILLMIASVVARNGADVAL